MTRRASLFAALVSAGVGTALAAVAPPADAGRVGPALARAVAARPDERVVAWVSFADRGGAERDRRALETLAGRWSPRSLERRRVRGTTLGVDATDLPVHAPYVRALAARGATVRGTSRWLNAASVELEASSLAEIARLPFVTEVELVLALRRTPGPEITPQPFEPAPGASSEAIGDERPAVLAEPGEPAWYGGSYKQNALIGAPALHAQGLSGAGVLVCMLDSGFRLTHDVFAGADVVATRDFVHNDAIVDDQPGVDDANEAAHGTFTSSLIVGRKDGTFAGVAFGASVALARTEDVSNAGVATETPVEMDYWQFAAEWADSLGADVISSSLGYSTFNAPYPSFTYADMDGRTSTIARAAAEAARRGISVVVSAGNQGASAWHFIATPADADTVITVGAVDSTNAYAAYSGHGPTADGRTKPDVVAMGSSVLVARFSANDTYMRVTGTSVSCPLVAGMAALLLEAHPGWGPFEVREALRQTALNAGTPNNDIGWGLVQGQNAVTWMPSTTGVGPGTASDRGALALAAGPNPARGGTFVTIHFAAGADDAVTLDAFDARGRRVARLFEGAAESGRSVSWDGRDARGSNLPAGVYWLRLASRAGAGEKTMRIVLLP